MLIDRYTGCAVGAKGGSELMYDELMRRLPSTLSDPFQIIVSRVRELRPDKKPLLWIQEPWKDDELQHLRLPQSRRRFKKIVFVSNYQFNTFRQGLGVPYSESIVLPNAINAICDSVPEKPRDQIRVVYHTMPNRGLALLLPVFLALAEQRPKLHLDVYSSFGLYGIPERDSEYEALFDVCRHHPQITYHGAVPNEEIREALRCAHVFAYPSIKGETFCIAAVEAMSAGCLVVCPDLAALSETVSSYGVMYRWTEKLDDHKIRFASALMSALDMIDGGSAGELLATAHQRVERRYTWRMRIAEWTRLLEEILERDRAAA